MKKRMRAASLCLAICMLLTVFAGAASTVRMDPYRLDSGNMALALPADWTVDTDCADGTLLTASSGNLTLTVTKQRVYSLIDPVEPPVSTYGTGTSAASVEGTAQSQVTLDASGLSVTGSLTVNGTKFSTYFTEEDGGSVRRYWTVYGNMEYRLTFTCTGAFSEAELELVGEIVNSVEFRWSVFQENSQPSQTTGSAFGDLEGHWARAYAYRAAELGLFQGVSATRFAPDETMSRAMLVTVLHRMAGKPTAGEAGFMDVVAGSYYAEAVAWAAANGIVQGADGKFRPNDPVTRQELAVILYRYDGFSSLTAAHALQDFSDAAAVASWAKDAMAWAVVKGLINGSDGKLAPTAVTTRAQAAAILVRYVDGQ